ncbi:hypothetical protein STVIR_8575 [Streptomyces viridochromogenes Tue57]|uniref:Uncharacterized protein n=1 Tax=Streptomyces viridochromogenes Tue57 TaxID=1160705 RepID=L8P2T0_STRVR|nr:hypothetical protein STVIR_8575 [Streptomyces viridochromogenes Tue57]
MYAAGDVARWYNPLFGAPMRIEHRTNAAEQGMAAARNLLQRTAACAARTRSPWGTAIRRNDGSSPPAAAATV